MEDTIEKFKFTSMRVVYAQITDKFVPLVTKPDVKFCCAYKNVSYKIAIHQSGIRVIEVEANQSIYWAKFTEPLYVLERLLMLLDGAFLPIEKVQFYHGFIKEEHLVDESIEAELQSQIFHQRLSYFKTWNNFSVSTDCLLNYTAVINEDIFNRWIDLLNELDIVNQMYLYTISDSGMPVDFRLAFMVELSESMVEILKEEKELFPDLHPGTKREDTKLKGCLKALIDSYGNVIFARETESKKYQEVLQKMVDSRVRIMHIKRNQKKKKYFDGNESVRYLTKLSLLYRVILLDLMNVKIHYTERLKSITNDIDRVIDRNED